MSTIIKDLGAVSAYAYAVEKGYTGTEAEFAELMADYAEVGQRAEDAAESALKSKTAAQTAATTAANKANEATTAAQTATTKAGEASTSASTATSAKDTAVSASQTATTKATEATTAAATATSAKTDAVTAKTAAETAQGKAEDAQAAAESVAESIPSDYSQLSEDVSDLKENLSDIFQTVTDYAVDVTSITGINTLLNQSSWNGGTYIGIDPNASYDSYWFVTDRDMDVYINPSVIPTYFAIVVGNAFTSKTMSGNTTQLNCGGTITRYRTSENNLPTSANKLHIPSGSAVAFTMTTGYTASIYGIGEPYNEVKKSFKNEVVGSKFLRYISGNGADSSTERVEIYIPGVSGYIRYDFLHCVDASINADVWRVGYAYHTDDNFSADYAITTTGEWECALKISGRNDFSGGIIHGDEVVQDITFVLDGTPVDITAYTSITAFTDLSIIENTKMYDPNDSSTVFANHGSEHAFIGDELVIRQSVKYVLAETIALGYMAMFPIAKAVSSILVPNSDFVPITLTGGSLVLKDTNNVTLYHPSGKVKAEFSIPTYDHFAGNLYTFMCNDNGGSVYNKCYYITTFFDSSVPVGKLSKTETRYRIIAK